MKMLLCALSLAAALMIPDLANAQYGGGGMGPVHHGFHHGWHGGYHRDMQGGYHYGYRQGGGGRWWHGAYYPQLMGGACWTFLPIIGYVWTCGE